MDIDGYDFPFFRNDESIARCDYLESDSCCDLPAEYLVRWMPKSYDGGAPQFSGACKAHVASVERSDVVEMSTHP